MLVWAPPRGRCQDGIEHARSLLRTCPWKWTRNQEQLGHRSEKWMRKRRKRGNLKYLTAAQFKWKFIRVSGESLVQGCLSEESHIFQGQACHGSLATLGTGWDQPREMWPPCRLQHIRRGSRLSSWVPRSVMFPEVRGLQSVFLLRAILKILPVFGSLLTFYWKKRWNKEFHLFSFAWVTWTVWDLPIA